MDDRPILVSSADRRYAMPLAVMLRSAVENCSAVGGLDIRVMDGGLGRSARRRILKSLPSDRCTVNFVDVRRASRGLAGAPVFGHVSLATYYRFLIPELVPEAKCLYVDADAVVQGDLCELWREPLRGHHLLSVQEGTVTDPVPIAGLDEWGIPMDHPRLSAGVLALDLDRWRVDDPVPELLRYLKQYGHKVHFWDQDAMNVVLARRWGTMDGKWDVHFDCSREVEDSARELVRVKDAAIVHYASATKPWHYYAQHPSQAVFYRYLDETAWAGWRPWPPLRALCNRHHAIRLLRRLAAGALGCGRAARGSP
jgi:lipopolysaccharide biosynthesis glycosyltransferase